MILNPDDVKRKMSLRVSLAPKEKCYAANISDLLTNDSICLVLSFRSSLKWFLGEPSAPYNCTVYNITANSLSVACLDGYDGGLAQLFRLRVLAVKTDQVVANLTGPSSNFSVDALEPGTSYELYIWAENQKGQSPTVVLMAET